jgi:hypothetical protein
MNSDLRHIGERVRIDAIPMGWRVQLEDGTRLRLQSIGPKGETVLCRRLWGRRDTPINRNTPVTITSRH